MTARGSNRKENMLLQLNRDLLNYGNNLVLSELTGLESDEFQAKFDYNKIFHVKDEETGTIFVRNIKFPKIFETTVKKGKELKLPLDKINSIINIEYTCITSCVQDIVSTKEPDLALIKNTDMAKEFLHMINKLVNDGLYPESQINEFITIKKNFQKYLDLVVEEGFAERDDKCKNLRASDKLKLLFKDKKEMKRTVEKELFYGKA